MSEEENKARKAKERERINFCKIFDNTYKINFNSINQYVDIITHILELKKITKIIR